MWSRRSQPVFPALIIKLRPIKELPEPATTIVGDLSDREQVLIGLNLMSKEHV